MTAPMTSISDASVQNILDMTYDERVSFMETLRNVAKMPISGGPLVVTAQKVLKDYTAAVAELNLQNRLAAGNHLFYDMPKAWFAFLVCCALLVWFRGTKCDWATGFIMLGGGLLSFATFVLFLIKIDFHL
jgi:hypothetical protein